MSARVLFALTMSVLVLTVGWATPQSKPVALRFGAVVTGLGQAIKDGVIVVEGDRIKSCRVGQSRRAGRRDSHRSAPVHGDPGPDRRAHAHDVLLGSRVRHKAAAAAAPRSRRRRSSWPPSTHADARDRRHDRSRSRRVRRHGLHDARSSIARRRPMVGPRMFVAGQGISAARGGGAGA